VFREGRKEVGRKRWEKKWRRERKGDPWGRQEEEGEKVIAEKGREVHAIFFQLLQDTYKCGLLPIIQRHLQVTLFKGVTVTDESHIGLVASYTSFVFVF